jgi:hypothetical protein
MIVRLAPKKFPVYEHFIWSVHFVFLKIIVLINFWHKIALIWVRIASFYPIFGENISEIIPLTYNIFSATSGLNWFIQLTRRLTSTKPRTLPRSTTSAPCPPSSSSRATSRCVQADGVIGECRTLALGQMSAPQVILSFFITAILNWTC